MTPTEYADILFSIYRKLDIHGNTKEPITTDEMITLVGLSKKLKEHGNGKNHKLRW